MKFSERLRADNKAKLKAKTNRQRQKARDERQRDLGRVGRKVWATPDEHEQIKAMLDKLRQDA